jgi:hypothetical protein
MWVPSAHGEIFSKGWGYFALWDFFHPTHAHAYDLLALVPYKAKTGPAWMGWDVMGWDGIGWVFISGMGWRGMIVITL